MGTVLKILGTVLFVSPLLLALIGVAIGCIFKPIMLQVITGIIAAGLGILFFTMDLRGWGGMIFTVLARQGCVLLVPMWVSWLIKHLWRDSRSLKKLKEKTLD